VDKLNDCNGNANYECNLILTTDHDQTCEVMVRSRPMDRKYYIFHL